MYASPPTARRFAAVAAGTLLLGPTLIAVVAACGARDLDAPAPQRPAALQECRDFEALMPRFNAALEAGRTEGLRIVIQEQLLTSEQGPPPITDVLRAIFMTLAGFAAMPPEAGAPDGQVCADPPPPLAIAHPLCELRRATDSLVHEGKGLQALELADPLLAAVFEYIVGSGPRINTSHYEVATELHDLCRQTEECRTADTLDLVIAFSAYMESTGGSAAINRMVALVNNPALEPFLQDDGAQYGGEGGIVALVHTLITIVLAMDDPGDLDALPLDALPEALRPDLQAGLADLKAMLDPNLEPNILRPLKKVLNCYKTKAGDLEKPSNYELVRMIYRLGLEYDIPEFGLTTMMGAVKGLRETDERGTLIHLVLTLAKAVRADEQAMDSLAEVCRQVFRTRLEAGESKSPAELALPVIAEAFTQGIAGEAMCAIDTLVYGCAGGTQPACEAAH